MAFSKLKFNDEIHVETNFEFDEYSQSEDESDFVRENTHHVPAPEKIGEDNLAIIENKDSFKQLIHAKESEENKRELPNSKVFHRNGRNPSKAHKRKKKKKKLKEQKEKMENRKTKSKKHKKNVKNIFRVDIHVDVGPTHSFHSAPNSNSETTIQPCKKDNSTNDEESCDTEDTSKENSDNEDQMFDNEDTSFSNLGNSGDKCLIGPNQESKTQLQDCLHSPREQDILRISSDSLSGLVREKCAFSQETSDKASTTINPEPSAQHLTTHDSQQIEKCILKSSDISTTFEAAQQDLRRNRMCSVPDLQYFDLNCFTRNYGRLGEISSKGSGTIAIPKVEQYYLRASGKNTVPDIQMYDLQCYSSKSGQYHLSNSINQVKETYPKNVGTVTFQDLTVNEKGVGVDLQIRDTELSLEKRIPQVVKQDGQVENVSSKAIKDNANGTVPAIGFDENALKYPDVVDGAKKNKRSNRKRRANRNQKKNRKIPIKENVDSISVNNDNCGNVLLTEPATDSFYQTIAQCSNRSSILVEEVHDIHSFTAAFDVNTLEDEVLETKLSLAMTYESTHKSSIDVNDPKFNEVLKILTFYRLYAINKNLVDNTLFDLQDSEIEWDRRRNEFNDISNEKQERSRFEKYCENIEMDESFNNLSYKFFRDFEEEYVLPVTNQDIDIDQYSVIEMVTNYIESECEKLLDTDGTDTDDFNISQTFVGNTTETLKIKHVEDNISDFVLQNVENISNVNNSANRPQIFREIYDREIDSCQTTTGVTGTQDITQVHQVCDLESSSESKYNESKKIIQIDVKSRDIDSVDNSHIVRGLEDNQQFFKSNCNSQYNNNSHVAKVKENRQFEGFPVNNNSPELEQNENTRDDQKFFKTVQEISSGIKVTESLKTQYFDNNQSCNDFAVGMKLPVDNSENQIFQVSQNNINNAKISESEETKYSVEQYQSSGNKNIRDDQEVLKTGRRKLIGSNFNDYKEPEGTTRKSSIANDFGSDRKFKEYICFNNIDAADDCKDRSLKVEKNTGAESQIYDQNIFAALTGLEEIQIISNRIIQTVEFVKQDIMDIIRKSSEMLSRRLSRFESFTSLMTCYDPCVDNQNCDELGRRIQQLKYPIMAYIALQLILSFIQWVTDNYSEIFVLIFILFFTYKRY